MAMTAKQEDRLLCILRDLKSLEHQTLTPENEVKLEPLRPFFPQMRKAIELIIEEREGFLAFRAIEEWYKGYDALLRYINEISKQNDWFDKINEIDFDAV